MSYTAKIIKKGIRLHLIKSNKFKTNLIGVFITTPLERRTVTKNAMIPAILKRGTMNLKSQEEINIKLEDMYGAVFDCGIDKTGDNQVLKFYLETINDEYTLLNENVQKQALDLILDIIFNPLVEDGCFNKSYVETEKENVKNLIESKIDNKDIYAFSRCVEEMYKGKAYGLYKYGYVEDLKDITAENLYNHYKELINTSKIDIFISGEIKEEEIINCIKLNHNIESLQARTPQNIVNNEQTEIKEDVEVQEIQESKEITQGKLVIGMDLHFNKKEARYPIIIYNVILGESATSKLFQNVREKASLAYTARSAYIKQKGNIFIRCGIEIKKYKEALKIIKKQIEDMREGNFTDEDLANAKKYMISGIKAIQDEQDAEIIYYLGQELSGEFTTFDEYSKKIEAITMEQVVEVANRIKINTIYFLKD